MVQFINVECVNNEFFGVRKGLLLQESIMNYLNELHKQGIDLGVFSDIIDVLEMSESVTFAVIENRLFCRREY